jgi:hypothetical protein
MFGARPRTLGWVPIQQVELKSERFAMAYRLLFVYAFILPGSSKIAHTRIRNIGPTTKESDIMGVLVKVDSKKKAA